MDRRGKNLVPFLSVGKFMNTKYKKGSATLLASDEPPAFELLNAAGKSHLVLLCDHASKRVPRALSNLGLAAAQLNDHIGWDPGAADVARLLSHMLDAPLVLSGYSRLVIDCNRPLQSAQSIPAQSGGVLVPGNQFLSTADRALRVKELFNPYHNAINDLLTRRQARATLLLSIHSFTANLQGQQRPWQIGISHWRDDCLAALLIDELKALNNIVVGENQPYAIDTEFDYAIPIHGERRGLPSAMIELRQDGISSPDGVAFWVDTIAQVYRKSEGQLLKPDSINVNIDAV